MFTSTPRGLERRAPLGGNTMSNAIDRFNSSYWLSDFFWKDPFDCAVRTSTTSQCKETDAGIEISLDLPGVEKENVKITSESMTLFIESKRDGVTSKKSYIISKEYDLSLAEAKLELGVLKVKLPKKSLAPPNVIHVK